MSCYHCGATTTNGLALCDLCQRKAATCLDVLPIYYRNLARWRPGRAGARPVPGSRVLYDGAELGVGTGDRISDRLDEATTCLTTWARALIKDRPHFPRPLTLSDAVLSDDLSDVTAEALTDNHAEAFALLCAGFTRHLVSLSTLDWCGELVRDLTQHEEILRSLTETLVPGWYAGACARCEASTYVVPGLTWVTCRACGATTHAADHLETILQEARGWVARPRRIAEVVVALVDTELSVPKLHERIRKWEQRDKIQAVKRSGRGYVWSDETRDIVVATVEVGYARYRLGQVLDLVYSEGTTRLTVAPAAPDAAAAS